MGVFVTKTMFFLLRIGLWIGLRILWKSSYESPAIISLRNPVKLRGEDPVKLSDYESPVKYDGKALWILCLRCESLMSFFIRKPCTIKMTGLSNLRRPCKKIGTNRYAPDVFKLLISHSPITFLFFHKHLTRFISKAMIWP